MITETTIRERLIFFTVGALQFEAYHVPPAQEAPGLVVNEDRWVLSKIVYQSHRKGNAIQRAPSKRRGREKQVGVFDTLCECRMHIETIAEAKDTP